MEMMKPNRKKTALITGATSGIGAAYALAEQGYDLIENAEKAFDETSRITDGNLLMVDYFKAKLLATAKKDPDLFDHLVERILTADPAILKGGTLLNAIAQEKTKYLKKQRKALFP